MKKGEGVLLVICFSVLFVSFASAANTYINETNKAFNCLDNRVSTTASLSLEEAVFSALAKVPNTKVNTTIMQAKSSSAFCWPSSGCSVKDTAQVALAKLQNREPIRNITDWLKSKAGVSEDLTWYLQVTADGNIPASCVLNYGGSDHAFKVGEDMKLSGTIGSCFSYAKSNYWLRIQKSCLDDEFNIQCNESFKTNLLYEKSAGGTVYVSAETHGAASGAWTLERIQAQCFKEGAECDYEGSLWATMALYANGEDVSRFAPYLRAFASDNAKYFPSTFLIAVVEGREEHYAQIVANQRARPEGSYWEASNTAYNKFYDTSLAMLALGGADAPEIGNAKVLDYLFDKQDASGCFNSENIRDTAFIIYAAGWQRAPASPTCNSATLQYCTNESACTAVGGYWYDNSCHSTQQLVCGNGIVNGSEACDCGTDGACSLSELSGQSCASKGYTGGSLGCVPAGATNQCTFNVSQCTGTQSPVCGDGMINGSEVCDGTNLGVENCTTKGYTGGTLLCASNCLSFNVSSCQGGSTPPPVPGGNNGTNNGSTPPTVYDPDGLTDCELDQLFCAPSRSSCVEAGGTYYPQETHACASHLEWCCTVDVPESNCASLGGTVCAYNEECTGSITEASDGACCSDICQQVSSGVCSSDSDCVSGRVCLNGECVLGSSGGCSSDNDCDEGESCSEGACVAQGGSNLWIWIAVFIVLIILVVLGIVYRDKLRLWWFKLRGKSKTSRIPPPGFPPMSSLERRPVPRFGMPLGPRPSPPPVSSQPRPQLRGSEKPAPRGNAKDSEAEETFKKLKEMSK